jgi:Serine acetyltransferase
MGSFMNAVNKYRRAHWLATHHAMPLARLYEMWIYLIHNCFIPASCEIGEGTTFGYKGIGVVVHSRARIGRNCTIAQNVTIGGRAGHYEVPTIGDNCYIGAGAKVLGPITLGDNVTIGANAVMLCDAPSDSVWGGGAREDAQGKRGFRKFAYELGFWAETRSEVCGVGEVAFVANVLFGSNIVIDLDQPSGIAKKVAWQASAFQAVTGDVAYCQFVHEGALIITRPDFSVVDRVELSEGRFQRIDQYAKLGDWAAAHKVRFLYYRFDHYDSITHGFFKRMKRSGAKVVMEFATYPYEAERAQRHKALLVQKRYGAYLARKLHVVDERLCIPRAKHVLDGLVTYMPHGSIWGIPVIQIDNGVDLDAVPLAQPEEGDGRPFTMVCVANLSFWHGLDRLLRGIGAYARRPDARPVRLLVASPETGELGCLRSLVEDLGIGEQVVFLGPQTGSKLDELFDGADVAIGSMGLHRIGLDHGSTLKVKEYCARGVPFVYAYTEAQLDGNEPFALKVSASEGDIEVTDILAFCDGIEDRAAMARFMRDFARDRFSWESQMAVLVDAFYGADCHG